MHVSSVTDTQLLSEHRGEYSIARPQHTTTICCCAAAVNDHTETALEPGEIELASSTIDRIHSVCTISYSTRTLYIINEQNMLAVHGLLIRNLTHPSIRWIAAIHMELVVIC